MDLLVRELHRSHREQKSTAILLGDVDHFKRVNDTLGHVVSDEVLIEIVGRLLKSVRSYDFVGRYGGEEFLVVLSVALYEAKAAGRDCLRMAQPGAKVEASNEMIPQAVRPRR